MPKMKSKKAVDKRIKVTRTGIWLSASAYISHLAPAKTTKQKRQSRGWKRVSKSNYKRLRFLIWGGR